MLEAINKIGSLANGPLLALFAIAVFRPAVGAAAALAGFGAGIAVNAAVWLLVPAISWLWWNPLGLVTALGVALAWAVLGRRPVPGPLAATPAPPNWVTATLGGAFVLMLALLATLQATSS